MEESRGLARAGRADQNIDVAQQFSARGLCSEGVVRTHRVDSNEVGRHVGHPTAQQVDRSLATLLGSPEQNQTCVAFSELRGGLESDACRAAQDDDTRRRCHARILFVEAISQSYHRRKD
jgi:hypothetical protein